jgi:DtxR family transcriptional regulator, Mn-dependent transcriptional regulator
MQTFCGLTTDGMLEYLAAIYKLAETAGKVTTSALAERMSVSPAAASSMLKRLEDSGFAERSSADGVLLTRQGELAALQLIRRHRLLEVFLIKVMGFSWDQVDVEAHRLEHSVSNAFEDRMDVLCDYPTHCPHGDPIPRKDGTMPKEKLLPITNLQPGECGTLRRVGLKDASVLRYLSQLKLTPGRVLRLVDRAPFNGPITLELMHHTTNGNGDGKGDGSGDGNGAGESGHENRGGTIQILGSELATQLYVYVTP